MIRIVVACSYAALLALLGRVELSLSSQSARDVVFLMVFFGIPFVVGAVVQRWWAVALPLAMVFSQSIAAPKGTVYDDSAVVMRASF
jgi:hypothetical protein